MSSQHTPAVGGTPLSSAGNFPDSAFGVSIASTAPSQLVLPPTGVLRLTSRVAVTGANLPSSAAEYAVVDFFERPVDGVRVVGASGSGGRVILQLDIAASAQSQVARLQARPAGGATASAPLTILSRECGQRSGLLHPFLTIGQAPPPAPTRFRLVLRYADALRPFVKPALILLNSADPAQAALVIDLGRPLPSGVVDDEQNGTISLFVGAGGPWFIQSYYRSDGDVVCYAVLSAPQPVRPDQERVVDIAQSLALHSLAFRPVDSAGREIDSCPATPGARVVFQFIHRGTGHFVQGLAAGFGKSSRILVSDVSPDYSFGAVGGFGREFGRPLHLYLYSRRNGIRGDVQLANTAGQLLRREVLAYPNADLATAFLVPTTGMLLYNAGDVAAIAPEPRPKLFATVLPNLVTAVTPGSAQEIFVFGAADSALDLADPANARVPDFPAFCLRLSGTGDIEGPADARDTILFTSPIFTGNADPSQGFFSVDPARAQFDRLEVPAQGRMLIGSAPLFDATAWVRDSNAPDFVHLRAQRFMAADNRADLARPGRLANSGYVSHLSADGANQGEVVHFRDGAEAAFTLRRNDVVINQGKLPAVSATPVLLPNLNRGNYDFVLRHPGLRIGGTLIPVVTKSSFKVAPGLAGTPPALRKLQLLGDGRLANAVDPAAAQNLLLLNVDPVPGTDGAGKLQTLALTARRVTADVLGEPRELALTTLPNGDWQAALPPARDAVRFDLRLLAVNVAGNRLVTRFSLQVGGASVPGPAPAPDEP